MNKSRTDALRIFEKYKESKHRDYQSDGVVGKVKVQALKNELRMAEEYE